ncbi:MAG: F0F1 ATP synthase subunit A [Christensenellales bacterium]|jgi:F-type H+-transporting ATPase subunit a
MESLNKVIAPGTVSIPVLNIEVGESMLVAWAAMVFLILGAAALRIFVIPKFRDVPGRFQMLIETMVDGVSRYTHANLNKGAEGLVPYVLTVAMYIILMGLFQLFGVRAPMADLSMTAGLATISFFLILAYAVRYKGVWGTIKGFGHPKLFMAPVTIITDLAKPLSLACRLFGNMLGGLIVMELLYAVCAPIIPAFFAIYFDLFHMLIQSYIFLTLTMVFIRESVER